MKAMKAALGRAVAHVQRQRVVLAAVRLVGDDDDVAIALESTGYLSPFFGAELLDQGEDVAVILAEQLLQVLCRFRPAPASP